ncbi:Glycosyltransferase family 1 protein [Mycena venus]|uniref:Glycosyltransferase family 1 protein n=1 Tax=Mycena venus TaxID=2733690 RepID=A0A8H6X879_9AGAR|nr:Glycosyltransferase family 1 protein [Mycena venus]
MTHYPVVGPSFSLPPPASDGGHRMSSATPLAPRLFAPPPTASPVLSGLGAPLASTLGCFFSRTMPAASALTASVCFWVREPAVTCVTHFCHGQRGWSGCVGEGGEFRAAPQLWSGACGSRWPVLRMRRLFVVRRGRLDASVSALWPSPHPLRHPHPHLYQHSHSIGQSPPCADTRLEHVGWAVSHQFMFYTLGEDYHALILVRRYQFAIGGAKIDIWHEVEVSTFVFELGAMRVRRGGVHQRYGSSLRAIHRRSCASSSFDKPLASSPI